MKFLVILSCFVILWSINASSATFVNTVRPWCDEDVDVCELELNISRSETMKLFGPDGATHAQPLVLQPGGGIILNPNNEGGIVLSPIRQIFKRNCSIEPEPVTYEGKIKQIIMIPECTNFYGFKKIWTQ